MYKTKTAFFDAIFLHFGAVIFTPNWKNILSEESEKIDGIAFRDAI